jgi:hypothetical protein
MTLLSAFGGGLFIIPVGLFLAAIWSFYRGIKQWRSGSTWTTDDGVQHTSNKRVGFFTVGATIFGIIFLLAAIGSAIWMYSER